MNRKQYILTFSFILVAISVLGQTPIIEALTQKVYAARNDRDKLSAYITLADEYQSLYRDSLDKYAPEIVTLAEKSNDPIAKAGGYLAFANYYNRWGWADSALFFIEKSLQTISSIKATSLDLYFKIERSKALTLGSRVRYAEALEVLYKILPEAEKYGDAKSLGLICNTIGSISIGRQQSEESLQWINRAITLSKGNPSLIQVYAPACLNMAMAYITLGKPDSAQLFINQGLPFSRQLQNLNYIATGLRIQSIIYTDAKKYPQAEQAILEMMAVRRKTGPANIFIDDNLQLAEFYANSGQLDKAIKICKDNLNRGKLENNPTDTSYVYSNDPKVRVSYLQALMKYYKMAGRMPDYQQTMEELIAAKDTLYEANSAEAIADLQTKYEVQKKETTIIKQKLDLQTKNFLLYGSLAAAFFIAIASFIVFRNYKEKKRLEWNVMMEQEKRNATEAVKKAEENERVRIAADLHDNLGAYAASLLSNVQYINLSDNGNEFASNALEEIKKNSGAIVSQLNDTIWVLKKEALSLTSISDRIKLFIKNIGKSYPGYQIDVTEDIVTDSLLQSSHAFHLYRILQEAINNALKHSDGKKIVVNFKSVEQQWSVYVEDDGIGFDLSLLQNENGNGLQHIMQRSKECGWITEWTTGPNKNGTRLSISTTN